MTGEPAEWGVVSVEEIRKHQRAILHSTAPLFSISWWHELQESLKALDRVVADVDLLLAHVDQQNTEISRLNLELDQARGELQDARESQL